MPKEERPLLWHHKKTAEEGTTEVEGDETDPDRETEDAVLAAGIVIEEGGHALVKDAEGRYPASFCQMLSLL